MILDRKSGDIPPKINILNMVIPILIHFCACLPLKPSSQFLALQATCHPTKCDVTNNVKLFPTVYLCNTLLSQISNVIQSDMVLQILKVVQSDMVLQISNVVQSDMVLQISNVVQSDMVLQ